MTIKEKLEELQKEYLDIKSKYSKEFSEKYVYLFEDIFQKYPELKSFSFPAYIPYFNDGNECVFTVHDVQYINGIDIYDYDELTNGLFSKGAMKKAIEEIDAINYKLDSSIFQATFGDHSLITVGRNMTVDIDYYEHD
jgi:hypothetical protein